MKKLPNGKRKMYRSRLAKGVTSIGLSATLIGVALAAPGSANQNSSVSDAEMDQISEALIDLAEEVPEVGQEIEATALPAEDLIVNPSDGVAVASGGNAKSKAKLPTSSGDPIQIENEKGALEVGFASKAAKGEMADDGSVIYADAYPDTDVVTKIGDNGTARIISIIKSENAPQSFEYPVSGADSALLDEDGSVRLLSQGELVGSIEAPWAYDANGAAVPTRYTTEGSTVTLNVDHTSDVAYPVVADPWFSDAISIGKCAGSLALAFGPLFASKLATASAKLAVKAKNIPKLAAAIKKLGGATSALKTLLGGLISKLPGWALGKLPGPAKSLVARYTKLSPGGKKAVKKIRSEGKSLILGALGIESCAKLLSKALG